MASHEAFKRNETYPCTSMKDFLDKLSGKVKGAILCATYSQKKPKLFREKGTWVLEIKDRKIAYFVLFNIEYDLNFMPLLYVAFSKSTLKTF